MITFNLLKPPINEANRKAAGREEKAEADSE
jgi:hypothetical protein